jgi:hypothetical protein
VGQLWQWLIGMLSGGGGGSGGEGSPMGGSISPAGAASFMAGGGAPTATPGAGGGGMSPQSIIQMLTQFLTTGSGAYYGINELQQQQRIFDQQQQNNQIAMNPLAMAARMNAATPPINRQLAYAVNQASNAGTAENGMGQSPGAVAAGQASALAPYGEQTSRLGRTWRSSASHSRRTRSRPIISACSVSSKTSGAGVRDYRELADHEGGSR